MHAGDAATDAALAVVAADQFASRRIAATLGAGGLPAAVISRTVDELLADPAASGLDAVVLAIDPSRPEGLAAVRKLVKALGNSRVVVVSVAVLGAGVRSALSAGASAFVAEVQLESTLAVATRSALAGQVSLPRELHRCAVRPAFSHREKQVLALVVRGLGNRQIAGAPLPLREHGQEPPGLRLPEAGRALPQGGRHRAARPRRGSRRKHSLRTPGSGRMTLPGDSAAGRD